MELGWPLPKRREYLKQLDPKNSVATHRVEFQGQMRDFPIFKIPLGLPLYRLENGRTTGRQREYLSKHPEIPKDFFRADGESIAAQTQQHKILVEITRERKNLFKEFETKPQTEPIILTSLGYVVNGNRRLSTWRELYESDKSKYERFRNVEIVLLPHADEKEIDQIEAYLQLKEDLKADYSWTSTALMMKEKMERYAYSEDDLAALYHKDRKALNELLDMLDYAESYLEARDIPNQFSEVDAKEYAFFQIVNTRKKWKASAAEKEVFEKAAFCLTDEPGEGKRIYSEIPKVADHLEKIVDSVSSELGIETEGLSDDAILLKVSEALTQKENFDSARAAIRDAIEAAEYAKKDKKKKDYVSSLIHSARNSLTEAQKSIENQSTKTGVIKALDDIEGLIEKLRIWAADDGK